MSALFERISTIGIVPVIAIENAEHAAPLADTLVEGGLPAAEITFRTAAAAEVLAPLRDRRPELLVGAGTILDTSSLKAAKATGAAFGLAPGYDREIVVASARIGFPFLSGVMTPSELGSALNAGIGLCNFFPAGIAGGPEALTGISFAHLAPRLIPTGGVTEDNIPNWLALKCALAVGGSWLATTAEITGAHWTDIAVRARSAIARVRAARGAQGWTR
jgi:2-dehydro-3-deoxyphosphogluconate aldolase/(4S)-4-hydroxy-2-oxoglutarate aldolase